jgi:hypothetical protein
MAIAISKKQNIDREMAAGRIFSATSAAHRG